MFAQAHPAFALLVVGLVLGGFGSGGGKVFGQPGDGDEEKGEISIVEARGRARLLHEVLHGALQVMHRDFFDEDERDVIPSASLEDVFEVLEEQHAVELRWLGVNARVMDSDHKPRDEFEEAAVRALAKGEHEFEAVEDGRLRYAGAIELHNQCLKCHVPNRTSLEDRAAGLLIYLPLKTNSNQSTE